jgi:hypothetical protein
MVREQVGDEARAYGAKSRERGDRILVADEVWVVTALLHREHPEREDFTVSEIMERARRENILGHLRPGLSVHINQHCVANRPPDPGRYLMLVETTKGRRRLYRPGDPSHPKRAGAKARPERADLPPRYQELLDWYATEYVPRAEPAKADPILALRGLGKEVWAGEDPDSYVARLRRDWQ